MLSLKKGSLIRDLWEQRSTECSDEERQWQDAAHKPWKALMKGRDGKELKDYLSSLRCGDAERHCWLVSPEDTVVGCESVSPQFLCARAFRWPELESGDELQRLDQEAAVCASGGSVRPDGLVCCSPFHVARIMPSVEEPLGLDEHRHVCTSETSIRRLDARHTQTVALPSSGASYDSAISVSPSDPGIASLTGDSATTVFSSLTTDSRSSGCRPRSRSRDTAIVTRSGCSAPPPWLMVRYGEFNARVGKIEQVAAAKMEVFYREEPAAATAQALAQAQNPSSVYAMNLRLKRNRDRVRGVEERQRRVGRGFLLWRKSYQCVYLYNRSPYAVYVQSPTLSRPDTQQRVHRVPSGRSFKIFDRARAAQVRKWYECREGSVPRVLDLHSCRMSLSSGWGHENPRHPTLFDCHCWFEVHFTFPSDVA